MALVISQPLVNALVADRAPSASAPMMERGLVEEDSPDESLMLAYAAGEAGAFSRLYDRHAKRVHRFIARSLGTRHASAADDVLQDTWISVARQAARYAPTARFTTWLFTVARSRVIDHLRRQGRGSEVSLDADDDTGDNPSLAAYLAADERHEPLRRLEHREQALAFFNALETLPLVAQREAFCCKPKPASASKRSPRPPVSAPRLPGAAGAGPPLPRCARCRWPDGWPCRCSARRHGGTALIPACHHGHVAVVRELLQTTSIERNHVNDLGWTALLEAVILGDSGARHTEAAEPRQSVSPKRTNPAQGRVCSFGTAAVAAGL